MRALLMLAVLLRTASCFAAEPAWIKEANSPDGKMIAEARAWLIGDVGNYCEVTVRNGKDVIYWNVFQPDQDVRYFRFSWSPDSRALLIGEGYKPGMDLTLLRFAKGKASTAHFDSDTRIDRVLLKELPFREAIKSAAPVGGVAWRTMRWKDGACEMTYTFHGIGYEGEAALRIDWRDGSPELKIVKISPTLTDKNRNDT